LRISYRRLQVIPGKSGRAFDKASLSVQARQLYLAILHGASATDSPVLDELLDFGLVVPLPHGTGGTYMALNPREAGATRRERLLQQVAGAMADVAALPDRLRDLEIAYQVADPEFVRGAVEHVEGVEPINARISEIAAGCTQEVLAAQPGGPRPSETLALSKHRDTAALRRGVAFRTLYHASVRSDRPTAEWTVEMTAEGVHVRTLDEEFIRALVFDRRTAVLQDYTPWLGPGQEPARVLIVHDEGLVHYVAAMFDRDWARAAIWDGVAVARDSALTDMQKSVMRHLATGASQASVASALGISERTVQAELGKMRRTLGYTSTVQMAYELGRQLTLDEASAR
jgi:DNA-binding CsgD family transcriptional regulator